jgi:hypothetical protein
MKTSQRILLAVTAILSILIFTTMILIRDDIETQFVKDDGWNFKSIAVDQFDRLEFGANYQADIVSGMEYSVEIAVNDSVHVVPAVNAIGGTLYFSSRVADSLITKPAIRTRITMPFLKSLRGSTGSEISIRNFQADSMTVRIEKGCVLKGKENAIKFLTFQVGDVLLDWRNNP